MLKPFKKFSDADAAGLCKAHYNKSLIIPCRDCPAYKQLVYGTDQFACLFKMKRFVSKYFNEMIDDGSISDDDLQWWQK